jgi:hypothetical protein
MEEAFKAFLKAGTVKNCFIGVEVVKNYSMQNWSKFCFINEKVNFFYIHSKQSLN